MTWFFIGIDWLYGSIALLLSMLGGMLPDLDSDSGMEIKHITSMTSVLSALLFWAASGRVNPPIAFEFRVWITLFSAFFWSRGLRWFLGKISVHRGMFHSIPTCFIWGSVMYLNYPHENHWVRVYMATGIMVGYMSHLLCDEYFSVESFPGLKVNKAFGTALKFWSGSLFSTLICYVILGLCVKQVGDVWPRAKDGKYVAIGTPSDSVGHLSQIAQSRVKNAVNTVRTKGLIAWLEELLSSARKKAEEQVDIVRENGLGRDGLIKTYDQIKVETKSAANSKATIETLKQIAVEAQSAVNDQVKVDLGANADRPLQTGQSNQIKAIADSVLPNQSSFLNSEKSVTSGGKSFQMETYQPRKRASDISDSAIRSTARKPSDLELVNPKNKISIRR
jgi:membrane-bound metal-dependent hydrolase YbcI (DUF457 family)